MFETTNQIFLDLGIVALTDMSCIDMGSWDLDLGTNIDS